MAYTKTTWNTGDVITAEKLNHMEDGIASAGGGGNLILSGESAPENSGIIDDMTSRIIVSNKILISDVQLGEIVYAPDVQDDITYYYPISSLVDVSVSPITNERDAVYTIPETTNAILVNDINGNETFILPSSTEWVNVISSGT